MLVNMYKHVGSKCDGDQFNRCREVKTSMSNVLLISRSKVSLTIVHNVLLDHILSVSTGFDGVSFLIVQLFTFT